jgi:hypothetical protein
MKCSKYWNHTTTDYEMFGFMNFLASFWRFIGKAVVALGCAEK